MTWAAIDRGTHVAITNFADIRLVGRVKEEIEGQALGAKSFGHPKSDLDASFVNSSRVIIQPAASRGSEIVWAVLPNEGERPLPNDRHPGVKGIMRKEVLKIDVAFLAGHLAAEA
jgi:hypothetical protein